MLVYQTNAVQVELFSYVNAFFFSNKHCIAAGHVSGHVIEICSVFIHVASSYANLVEQKKFFKKLVKFQ